jgi:hypothetical protein
MTYLLSGFFKQFRYNEGVSFFFFSPFDFCRCVFVGRGTEYGVLLQLRNGTFWRRRQQLASPWPLVVLSEEYYSDLRVSSPIKII